MLPEEPPDGWRRGGLEKGRYVVLRSDGSPLPPESRVFVLRYDSDPHARRAILLYADAVQEENPTLAEDLRREILQVEGDLGDADGRG
jgi:hypothetical protein